MAVETRPADVLIVGGGFSGLIAARAFSRAGRHCVVLESSERFGGVIGTRQTDGCIWEQAANGLLWTAEVESLFDDLKLEPIAPPRSAAKRFLETEEGALTRWPLSVVETFALVFRLFFILLRKITRVGWVALGPQMNESVFDFAARTVGRPLAERVMRIATQGIYAQFADQLSAQLVFGKYFVESRGQAARTRRTESRLDRKKTKRTRIRGTVAPRNGMSQLIQALVDDLRLRGNELHTEVPTSTVLEVVRAHFSKRGTVVLCCGARSAHTLLRKVSPDDPRCVALDSVRYKPVILAHRITRQAWPKRLQGFGALLRDPAAQGSRFRLLGVLQNSVIFPDRRTRKGAYSESWIVGVDQFTETNKTTQSESVLGGSSEDDSLKQLAGRIDDTVKRLTHGMLFECESVETCVWPATIPSYDSTLFAVQSTLWTPRGGIYLFGNYMGEIGLSGLLRKVDNLVEQVNQSKEH